MTPDDIDARAWELVRLLRAGATTEQDVRNDIGAMLYASTIATDVAWAWAARSPRWYSTQQLEDLADDLRLFAWEKARGIATERSGRWTGQASSVLDLDVVESGTSVCAWARQMMKTRCWYLETRMSRQREVLFAPSDGWFLTLAVEQGWLDAAVVNDVERLADKAAAARQPTARLRARAQALQRLFGLPPGVVDSCESAQLSSALRADPLYAKKQVGLLARAVESGVDPVAAGVAPSIVRLLGSAEPAVLDAMNADDRSASVVVRAAMAGRDAMSDETVAELARLAGRLDPVGSRLARPFAAMVSGSAEDGSVKRQSRRRRERREFVSAVAAALDDGMVGLGATVDEVEAALSALADDIERLVT